MMLALFAGMNIGLYAASSDHSATVNLGMGVAAGIAALVSWPSKP